MTQDSAAPAPIAHGTALTAKEGLPEIPSVQEAGTVPVPLIKLAFGRSGDKGDNANIGLIARKHEYLPYIADAMTENVVSQRFAHRLQGHVERFYLPGMNALNFLLHEALGGGGTATLQDDPLGKAYAQILLDHPIPVPSHIAEAL